MARRLGHKVDIVDAHKVARRYNEVWRRHVRFPTTGSDWEDLPRISDRELWDSGQPTINQGGTIGDGYAELKFVFRDVTEDHADRWVRNFLHENKLPHTYYKLEPPRNTLSKSNKYVRVIVRFEIDEEYNKRTRQLR